MGTRYQDAKCNLCNHCKLSLRRWGIGPCYLPRFAFLSPGTLPLRTILLSNLVVHLPPAWSVSGSNACVGMSVRDWVLLPLIFSSIPSSLVICLLDLPTSFYCGSRSSLVTVVTLRFCSSVYRWEGEIKRWYTSLPFPCMGLIVICIFKVLCRSLQEVIRFWSFWRACSIVCTSVRGRGFVTFRIRLLSLTLSLFRNALLYWFFSIFCQRFIGLVIWLRRWVDQSLSYFVSHLFFASVFCSLFYWFIIFFEGIVQL